jgi:FkbM family methyltransferase
MSAYQLNSFKYFVLRYLFLRKFLTARAGRFGLKFRFNTDFLLRTLELRDGDVVIDAGANIGWYSLLLAQATRNWVRFLAFEPDPLNYRLLCENIAANGCPQITAVQKALSDTGSTKTLYLYPNKNRGRHSLLPINNGETVDVPTVTLDSYLDAEKILPQNVAFFKIDVEGYELPVFKGARSILGKVPSILSEYSPGYMRRGGHDPKELLELLKSSGYAPFKIREGSLVPASFETLASSTANGTTVFWKMSAAA